MKKNINIPIYFGVLRLIFTDDISVEGKKFGLGLDGYDAFCDSDTFRGGLSRYTIVLTKDCSPSIIAHEASHCVNKIFKDRGIELDLDNDEPQCYLLGWVVKQCHEFLEKRLN